MTSLRDFGSTCEWGPLTPKIALKHPKNVIAQQRPPPARQLLDSWTSRCSTFRWISLSIAVEIKTKKKKGYAL